MRATAHECQLDLILDFFDVEGATGRLVAQQRIDHGSGELLHHVAHARAGSLMPTVDGEESLCQCDGYFVRLKRGNRTIATNDLVIGEAGFSV